MAQTRKSTKKTSTKQKASSTKKKTSAKKAAGTASSSGKSPARPKASKTATRQASPKASPKANKSTSPKANHPKADNPKADKSSATSSTVNKSAANQSAAKKKATSKRTAAKSGKVASASRSVDLPELDLVRGLADIIQDYGLEELSYDSPEVTITLKRPSPIGVDMTAVAAAAGAPAGHPVNVPAANAAPMLIASPPPPPPPDPDKFLERSGAESDEEHQVIKSPFVGTFYRRPSPDAEPYVTLGMRVSKGQVMCIIEAMKLMNEIECDMSGRVADILVEDAQPVEYGQPLFKITYS